MGVLRWPIFTLTILVSLQGFSTPLECDSQHFPVGSHCCAKCPGGYYRHRDCDGDRRTLCLQCPLGTYTEGSNYVDRCNLCKRCQADHGMEEKRECLPNQNRRCRCMKGFFLEPPLVPGRPGGDMCHRHQRCQPGEGVKKEGTRRSDATCAPCAVGRFSQGGNYTCQEWTDCASQGLKEMIPGTAEHDAVCSYEYIPPIASSVPGPSVGSVTESTSGSVSDRVETPGKPVARGPDEFDVELRSSSINPLQYGKGRKEREGAGASPNSHMSKKGNNSSAMPAVGIVVFLLLVGWIGVAAYCSCRRFTKAKGRTGEKLISVAYHRQSLELEDTVSLTETCVVDEETAVSAKPPPSLPPGQWPMTLQWPPLSSEIPSGTQHEGPVCAECPPPAIPITDEHLAKLAEVMPTNWKKIGMAHFQIRTQDLDKVRTKHPHDRDMQIVEMFKLWIGRNGKAANLCDLCQKLIDAGVECRVLHELFSEGETQTKALMN